jgi:CHAT domain-containing protein/lipopolysaccharide biosynthesis regulator YciM
MIRKKQKDTKIFNYSLCLCIFVVFLSQVIPNSLALQNPSSYDLRSQQEDGRIQRELDRRRLERLKEAQQGRMAELERNRKNRELERDRAKAIQADIQLQALAESNRLNQEALELKGKGRYDEAIPLAKRALEVVKKALGPNHYTLVYHLNVLAELYNLKGQYDNAEPLLKKALAISEKEFGSDNLSVAQLLSKLAEVYYKKGNYVKAEPIYQRILAIGEKFLGPEHPFVAQSLDNLAALYKAKGDYAAAEPLYQRALLINEKALGPVQPDVAQSLDNLALLYYAKGDYAKAESLNQKSLEISKLLNNEAELYYTKGNYAAAEPLYQRALTIREKILGPEHADVAQLLNNLAALYQTKGDYAAAEPLYQRALKIREKVLGPEHADVAQSLNNLALLYQTEGDYARAEPLYQRTLAISEKALGLEHPYVAQTYNNLAALYQAKGDYARAESFYQKALTISEKVLESDHPYIAQLVNNLAALYQAKGDYAAAEPLIKRSLLIVEKALGSDHPHLAFLLNNLAALYRANGDISQSIRYQSRANAISERDLVRNLATGSERQKLLYLNKTSFELDLTLSLHLQSAPKDLTAKQMAMDIVLRRKGRALDAMTDSIAIVRRRAVGQAQALLDELARARFQFSTLTLKAPDRESYKNRKEVKALEEKMEKLEGKISDISTEFRILRSQFITLQEIQQTIPEDGALIEFVTYQPYDAKTREYGKSRYVVYLLTSEGEPLFAELGQAEAIEAAAKALRQSLPNSRTDVEKEVKPAARALDELVMRPIRGLLREKRRLLISPDGVLNLIPFDALVDEEGHYLVERYEISYLTSGRDLLRLQAKLESKSQPVVMADPDFAEGPGPKLGENAFEPLQRLSATAAEAAEIKAKLADARVLMQAQATKKALKEISRPSILHIATHGFFLKDEPVTPANEAQRIAVRKIGVSGEAELPAGVKLENPLLRSGLFFAGANSKGEESTLTALEAAGLDLWGTKLVVLSACDTGVGEVKNRDGVYGLRRALVLAGAESQMMSLWPVSDEGTRELMVGYYEALKSGEGRSAGLRRVRLEMLKNPKRSHPYYWASFIQSGEWANLDGKR